MTMIATSRIPTNRCDHLPYHLFEVFLLNECTKEWLLLPHQCHHWLWTSPVLQNQLWQGGNSHSNVRPEGRGQQSPSPGTCMTRSLRTLPMRLGCHRMSSSSAIRCQLYNVCIHTFNWRLVEIRYLYMSQRLVNHRTRKPDFLCSWPSLNFYLKYRVIFNTVPVSWIQHSLANFSLL